MDFIPERSQGEALYFGLIKFQAERCSPGRLPACHGWDGHPPQATRRYNQAIAFEVLIV
jgi:hypothetical protein